MAIATPPMPLEEVDDPPTAPAQPSPVSHGRLVAGRYRVRHEIAKGGMGEVVLAEHVDLRRFVAIKILNPPRKAASALDFETRFRREARVLAAFSHPNIVMVHDFGVLDDGRVFLAMEYVEGPRLTDILRDGPLEPERAVRLISQVCKALRYAHARGVVHRDLKPSNILITEGDDGQELVKLVDFGIAQVDADPDLDGDGLLLGSPHYMAPEQIDNEGIDERTDIYALGVLLFRVLTGVYPFTGANTQMVLLAHLHQAVPPFRDVAPHLDLPDAFEAIVRRCLSKDQSDRYPDASTLMDELVSAIDLPESAWVSQSISTHGLTALTEPVAEAVRPEPVPAALTPEATGRGALGILLALACMVAGATLAWSVFPEPAPTDQDAVLRPAVPPALAAPATVVLPEPVLVTPAPSPSPARVPAKTATKARPVTAEPPPAPRLPPARVTPRGQAAPAAPAPTRKAPADAPSGYEAIPDDL